MFGQSEEGCFAIITGYFSVTMTASYQINKGHEILIFNWNDFIMPEERSHDTSDRKLAQLCENSIIRDNGKYTELLLNIYIIIYLFI